MPVLTFVRQVLGVVICQLFGQTLIRKISNLGVNVNNHVALITSVGEDTLITFDAVWMIFLYDIPDEDDNLTNTNPHIYLPVPSQAIITVMTKHYLKVQLLTRLAIGQPEK